MRVILIFALIRARAAAARGRGGGGDKARAATGRAGAVAVQGQDELAELGGSHHNVILGQSACIRFWRSITWRSISAASSAAYPVFGHDMTMSFNTMPTSFVSLEQLRVHNAEPRPGRAGCMLSRTALLPESGMVRTVNSSSSGRNRMHTNSPLSAQAPRVVLRTPSTFPGRHALRY